MTASEESFVEGRDEEPALIRTWRRILHVLLALSGILYLLDLATVVDLGFIPWEEQYVALVFGLALGSILAATTRRGARWATVPNAALSVLGIGVGAYLSLEWPRLATGRFVELDTYVGGLTILLLLEATRRSTGRVLFILGCLSVVFGLTAGWLPPPLEGRVVELERLILYLFADSTGIVGLPLKTAATVVLAFIVFGATVFASGGGSVFIDLALLAMGRFRGGPAKAAVVASSLFGSITGSAVSNVVATGSLTIPMMKRSGYPGHIAGGAEAVASTGGQLMPPVMGATAFIMADFLGRPYSEIALAAIVPAGLFYLCIFVQLHLEAMKGGVPRLDRSELPVRRDVLKRIWLLVVPLAALILLLFVYHWTPAKAGLASAGVAFLVGVIHRKGRVRLGTVIEILERSGRNMLDLLAITAVAGVLIGALGITGVGFSFALQLVDLAAGSVFLLLVVTALTGVILGMGMPTTGVYILLAVLAAPALVQLGVEPIAAHFFVLYFGMLSMITPPVCLAAFAAAAIAESNSMRTGLAAMRLGGATYVIPFIFAYSPVLLLVGGTAVELTQAVATASLGVFALGAALVGYLKHALSWISRAALVIASLLLIWPEEHGADLLASVATDLAGIVLFAIAVTLHWRGGQADAGVLENRKSANG